MGAPNALRGRSYSGNLSARQTHALGLLGMLAADYHPASILPAMKILAESDPDGLPGAARLLAQGPAEALGLTDRGRLAPGLRADLAAVDLSGPGRAVATWREGRPIHSDGTLSGL
ncbi:MAG: alpha-D-ribose 1-methylphosphonate 5-triphosphate diphosphatase, partial [Pseudomonadota bacterium]